MVAPAPFVLLGRRFPYGADLAIATVEALLGCLVLVGRTRRWALIGGAAALIGYLVVAVLSRGSQCACFGRTVTMSWDARVAVTGGMLCLHGLALSALHRTSDHDA